MERQDQEVTVKLFASVKDAFGLGEMRVTLEEGHDVGRLLESICTSPQRVHSVYDENRTLRQDVTVLVNGRSIVFLDRLRTALKEGDTVSVFPPVYGG